MFQYADYIYEIYKEGSFTAAAKKLFVSQPALSATVKKAETELGVRIFDRGSTPLRLTEEGRAYIQAVEKMYRVRQDFENEITDVSSLRTGSVKVGGAHFISSFVLPSMIIAFAKEYPRVTIEMLESDSAHLLQRLDAEELELMVDYNFEEGQYCAFPLLREHLLLAIPTAMTSGLSAAGLLDAAAVCADVHMRENTPRLPLGAVADRPFVLLKKGNDMYARSMAICGEADFSPHCALYLDQLVTAYNMARAGMGAAFVTDTLVKAAPCGAELRFLRLGGKHAERTLYIAHKRHRYISRAVREFIRIATELYS